MLGYVSDFAVFQSFGTFFEFFIALVVFSLGYRAALTLYVHGDWPVAVILIFVVFGIIELITRISFRVSTGFAGVALEYIILHIGFFWVGFVICSILYGFSRW